MKALNIKAGVITLLALLIGCTAFAQQPQPDVKAKKKVVIITKTTDEDGNVKTETIMEKGDDANVFIIEDDGVNIDVLKDFEIDVKVDGEKIENAIRLKIVKDVDGETKLFEWNGEGDMPAEMEQLLEDQKFHFEMDGDHNVFHLDGNVFESEAPDKACLGIRIGQKVTVENINGEETEVIEGMSEPGVEILGVITESGAEDAGLLEEDVITSINGSEVETLDDVLAVLAPFDPGATVSIAYLRNGQTSQTTATMKACTNTAVLEEIEEEFEIDGDVSGMKSKVVIIKKSNGGLNEIIETEDVDGDVFIPKTEQTLDLETIDIFPNPTDGKLTLEFKAPAKATTLKIYDLAGKEIYSETLKDFNGFYKNELNLTKAAKGTLLLSIQQDDKVFSEKIILQ